MPTQRFAVLTIEQILTATGYKIIVTTDVPCHLWMRWSLVEPEIHKIPILKRGVYIHADIRICFVVYTDNEQEEDGDTIIHTFIKEPWPTCETRYFIFWGTINGEPSPSTSGIFTKHRTAPEEPVFQGECWEEFETGEYTNPTTAWAYTFIPQVDYTLASLEMQGHKHTGVGDHDCSVTINLCPVTDNNMGEPISTAILDTTVLPHYTERWGDFTLDFTPVDLTAGQEYAVQFPPGVWGGTCYIYRIRTSKIHEPVNAKRGFVKSGEGGDWTRIGAGTYYFFHGKFYKMP